MICYVLCLENLYLYFAICLCHKLEQTLSGNYICQSENVLIGIELCVVQIKKSGITMKLQLATRILVFCTKYDKVRATHFSIIQLFFNNNVQYNY